MRPFPEILAALSGQDRATRPWIKDFHEPNAALKRPTLRQETIGSTTMKPASRLLQILALGACFTAQAHGAFSMPGVRQALRTIDGASGQAVPPINVSLEMMKRA
ncbi:MAG: hypothetical protein EOS05_15870 [Mesorhizobium sp.]|nr:MAG: hypothetical protein EOS05_15870 [Mesorhizobium sp.]